MKRPQLALASAVLAVLVLSGCSTDDLVERAAERSVEEAGGGDADIDLDLDSGDVSVSTDEGSFSSGSSLPDDFPTDEVPLVDGTILQAARSDTPEGMGYVVLVEVDGSLDDVLGQAEELLVGAGFEQDPSTVEMQGMSFLQYLKEPYTVTVQAAEMAEATTSLNYIVVLG